MSDEGEEVGLLVEEGGVDDDGPRVLGEPPVDAESRHLVGEERAGGAVLVAEGVIVGRAGAPGAGVAAHVLGGERQGDVVKLAFERLRGQPHAVLDVEGVVVGQLRGSGDRGSREGRRVSFLSPGGISGAEGRLRDRCGSTSGESCC